MTLTWDQQVLNLLPSPLQRLTLLCGSSGIAPCLLVIMRPEEPQWQAANDG